MANNIPKNVPSATYVERAISVTIKLGRGSFGQDGFDTVKLEGLRAVATIQKWGAPGQDLASVRIYGVVPSVMNKISTLGVPLLGGRDNNIVTIDAGDKVNGMATVFRGYIIYAWQDFNGMPETFIDLEMAGGFFDALAPVDPISFAGTADVATIMAGLATRMGRTFENNGVTVKLSNPYFSGTALQQAHKLAAAANIEMHDDGPDGSLAIWPKTGSRSGLVPLISPATGMIGYPRYQQNGASVRVMFNPSIKPGGRIEIRSSLGAAPNAAPKSDSFDDLQAAGPNGTWVVGGPLIYNLASQIPNGPWFCDIQAVRDKNSAK